MRGAKPVDRRLQTEDRSPSRRPCDLVADPPPRCRIAPISARIGQVARHDVLDTTASSAATDSRSRDAAASSAAAASRSRDVAATSASCSCSTAAGVSVSCIPREAINHERDIVTQPLDVSGTADERIKNPLLGSSRAHRPFPYSPATTSRSPAMRARPSPPDSGCRVSSSSPESK